MTIKIITTSRRLVVTVGNFSEKWQKRGKEFATNGQMTGNFGKRSMFYRVSPSVCTSSAWLHVHFHSKTSRAIWRIIMAINTSMTIYDLFCKAVPAVEHFYAITVMLTVYQYYFGQNDISKYLHWKKKLRMFQDLGYPVPWSHSFWLSLVPAASGVLWV